MCFSVVFSFMAMVCIYILFDHSADGVLLPVTVLLLDESMPSTVVIIDRFYIGLSLSLPVRFCCCFARVLMDR